MRLFSLHLYGLLLAGLPSIWHGQTYTAASGYPLGSGRHTGAAAIKRAARKARNRRSRA